MPDPIGLRIDELSQEKPQRIDQLRLLRLMKLSHSQFHSFWDDLLFFTVVVLLKSSRRHSLRYLRSMSAFGGDFGTAEVEYCLVGD